MNYSKQISILEAEKIAEEFYGISATAKPLPGEADLKFLLRDTNNESFTLKISHPETVPADLDFEKKLLKHLSQKKLPFQIPKLITSKAKQYSETYTDGQGQKRQIRMQSWVPGRMLSEVNPRTPELLQNWGRICGHLCKALQDFDHPVAHRFYKWNPSETLFSKQNLKYFGGAEEKKIASHFWDYFERETLPLLGDLRQSVNYNDAHEHNLLVDGNLEHPRISGVIDFGDALFTHTINELAIACAYAGMYVADPVIAMSHVVNGFHSTFPLQEKEIEVLYSLIASRLLITVSNAAFQKSFDPENGYLQISEKAAWDLLKKWQTLDPNLARCFFRDACKWPAFSQAEDFAAWCITNQKSFEPVIRFDNKSVKKIDLSIDSYELGNNVNFETATAFEHKLQLMLEDKSADIAVGGYCEVRPFYTTDAYKIEGNSGAQWRTIHLGTDIWTAAGAPVFAPWQGKVHSFNNNTAYRDYGPTIILEHETDTQQKFYTLYGHLSTDSIEGLHIGMSINKGQEIARVGAGHENGGWPPHLHFQLMLDMLGKVGDFPGVAFPEEIKVWKSICPNPRLLMPELPEAEAQADDLSADEITNLRGEKLGKSLSLSYQKPLHIVRGYQQYLYDTDARRYLDTVNNVAHLGHEHPAVVEVACRQMALLNTNTRYLHPNIVKFAEELLSTFPPELSVVYFVNSGSEANELAMRMAKTITGQKDIIAIETGYHGNTGACVNVSSYKFDGNGGSGKPEHTQILPMPDLYRGIHSQSKTPGVDYAKHIDEVIMNIKNKGRGVAAFLGESILSCGGQIMLPEGYLQYIYKEVRRAGGLCIADEVQVGFGRVGEKFWAYELQDVVPDIVTMGKPIGNGHPLAAVVTSRKIADAFANGMEYFNTFGGNPVSCAVGSAVLQVMRDEHLQGNALKTGRYLKQELEILQAQFPIIGDVRGQGLFLGFELVENPESKKPASQKATYLANRMRQRGILMSVDGPDNNVMKIKPPMCFNKENANFLIRNLALILKEDFMQVSG